MSSNVGQNILVKMYPNRLESINWNLSIDVKNKQPFRFRNMFTTGKEVTEIKIDFVMSFRDITTLTCTYTHTTVYVSQAVLFQCSILIPTLLISIESASLNTSPALWTNWKARNGFGPFSQSISLTGSISFTLFSAHLNRVFQAA